MENGDTITREGVLKLMERKESIEKELSGLKEILDVNNVSMNDRLIDGDDFPRQDIDVYAVRHARHKIICLQNDHKAIMKQIEEGLHFLHQQASETAMETVRTVKNEVVNDKPIARVNFIEQDSPASLAGLQLDDIILSFGTVNYENFKSLEDIGNVVRHSVGRGVPVIVIRGNKSHRLILTPKEWSGKGLLGCNIIPIEHIDR